MVVNSPLIFGPAYLDLVVETGTPLLPNEAFCLDQSLPASAAMVRTDGRLLLEGPTGDQLIFALPEAHQRFAATYHLAEPVLARLLGVDTGRTVRGDYPVTAFRTQIGGMGAGYAKAFGGVLRLPLGDDDIAQRVQGLLADHGIAAAPSFLVQCSSDTSLVVLSPRGEKLAVGVRQAMVRWRPTDMDDELRQRASALVFCGAPNALLAELLAKTPDIPVMCAPAMRNVRDTEVPLATLAPHIHYLTLNALEWEHLRDAESCLRQIPLISVTDGPHGSRVFLRGGTQIDIPAQPCDGPLNTNRAGETFGSTLFKYLMYRDPEWFRTGQIDAKLARQAGELAARQAARQLHITGFAFPPDDWIS